MQYECYQGLSFLEDSHSIGLAPISHLAAATVPAPRQGQSTSYSVLQISFLSPLLNTYSPLNSAGKAEPFPRDLRTLRRCI